jgi:hypothetical protein
MLNIREIAMTRNHMLGTLAFGCALMGSASAQNHDNHRK